MTDWTDVAPADEIKPGEHKIVVVDDVEIAVFNVDGEFLAIEDVCTHDGNELACGKLVGEVIECPRHGARFSLRSGAVVAPPAYEAVATFPVQVTDNIVRVRDDRWD